MPTATVDFFQLIQDSQEYGSDDAHMVSRVAFSLMIDGQDKGVLYAYLKQTVGADEKEPLEVSRPFENYDGPWNHEEFSKAAEKYYRSFVGPSGSSIKIGDGTVRMYHNLFSKRMRVSFPVP